LLFVRGLWGDAIVSRHGAILAQLEAAASKLQPAPLKVYCYGIENYQYTKRLGFDCVLMDHRPIVSFGLSEQRNPGHRGVVNFGHQIWRHKLAIIERALKESSECMWLDWDCNLTRSIPRGFMRRLRKGRDFQGTLIEMRQVQCVWRRVYFPDEGKSRRKVIEGALLYFRGTQAIERIIELQDTYPNLVDQQIFGMYTDEVLGGWPGLEAYKSSGFEFPLQRIYKQVWPCEMEVFATAAPKVDPLKREREAIEEYPEAQPQRRARRKGRLMVYGQDLDVPEGALFVPADEPAPLMEATPPDTVCYVESGTVYPFLEQYLRLRPGKVLLHNAEPEVVAMRHLYDGLLSENN